MAMEPELLTFPEQMLLISAGIFSVVLTGIVLICALKKGCWLYNCFWFDEKKNGKMEDVICIRYPSDLYPESYHVYRQSFTQNSDDEMSRLFTAQMQRDSTYSSMSETSSCYDVNSSPVITASSSGNNFHSPVSDGSKSEGFLSNSTLSPSSSKCLSPISNCTSPLNENGKSYTSPTSGREPSLQSEKEGLSTAAAAAVLASAAQRKFSESSITQSPKGSPIRQPFFTFALKYNTYDGLIHIDFIEARNLPFKDYLHQPSDVFFALEIQGKKSKGHSAKHEMMRYRFVTKTIRKAVETCDYSEKFLAQISKVLLKDYQIRFTAFDQDRHGNATELGSTTLSFNDFHDFTEHQLILSCSLKEPVMRRGEILLGLCYLPTAERLTVSPIRVSVNGEAVDSTLGRKNTLYIRFLLLRADTGKVIERKKTTYKSLTSIHFEQTTFNETVVFDMPATEVRSSVLLTLVCIGKKGDGSQNQTVTCPPSSIEALQPEEKLMEVSKSRKESKPGKNNDGNDRNLSIQDEMRHSRSRDGVVGKIGFGYSVRNKAGRGHWEKVMSSPRSVSTEWHKLY